MKFPDLWYLLRANTPQLKKLWCWGRLVIWRTYCCALYRLALEDGEREKRGKVDEEIDKMKEKEKDEKGE